MSTTPDIAKTGTSENRSHLVGILSQGPLEAEVPYWDAAGNATAGFTTLRGKNLEQIVAELANCRLFLGHDSGISHLAAGCGARCLLLFGPTEPATWAPPSPLVRVLQAGADLSALSPEFVLAAAQAHLADQSSA